MLRMLYVRNIVTRSSVGDTRTRILDAAFAALSTYGLGRMSLEDVAREAGLSRQTVYRYFGTKNELIAAAVLREEETFIAGVRAASEPHRDLRPAIEACIRRSLEMARAHPLLDRLLESEPEALLPFLTTGAGPVLSASHAVMVELLGERLPHLSAAEVHRAADTASRLLISYAINPPDDPIDEVASGLADLLVHGLKPN